METGAVPPVQGARLHRRVALFVFVDAFGWELLRTTPFLDDILVCKRPLESVFGYSSTCDPTILTGLMPRDHGHFSFFCYAPDKSPFRGLSLLGLLPRKLTSRGRVRHLLSRALKWMYGYTGYFQIYNVPFRRLGLFDYTEKRDIYEPGGINSGARTILDELRDRGVCYHLSDWRANERTNLDSLARALTDGELRFAYLYLAAMDGLLHAEGKSSPRIGEKIAWYEKELRRLLEIARSRYEEVALYVFSDHGMADVVETCDLKPLVDASGLVFGRDYAAIFDSTMARFWFLREGAREILEKVLTQESRGHILNETELKEFGCDFPGHKYGELFFLLNPGVLLCPSDMGEKPMAGMHGYDPKHPDSHAIFATTETLDVPPKHLTDLHALMMREVVDSTVLV